MGTQVCTMADVCYKCGGGNVTCKWQTTARLCKPSRAETAPWLLAIQDAKLAGTDLPSKLSLEMDAKCAFVCGLGRVLKHNPIDMVEAGIIGHARRWDPLSRIVMRVRSGHAFIFFDHVSRMNSFLQDAAVSGSSWGSIAVCNSLLGVKPYSG